MVHGRMQMRNDRRIAQGRSHYPMRNAPWLRGCVAANALAAALLLPAVGRAQDGSPPAQSEGIQDIVVTAQKRAENVQDIALAVTALDSTRLENTDFDSIGDLTRLAPGLQLSNFGPIAFVTLRGIGNENTTAGGDPGVALHYDGVYIGRPVGTLFTAFDTERVEVLRGPQGTLYGRNATGGSINYITKKPGREFEAEGDFTYGNFDRKRIRGVVNVPLSDSVSARIVGFRELRDGFTENAFPDRKNTNDTDSYGLRGHLQYRPDASPFNALLSVNYIRTGGAGTQPELREPFPGSTTGQNIAGPPIPGTNNYLVNGVPILNDLRPFHESKDTQSTQRTRLLLISGAWEYDFGPVTLKSITGYAETSYNSLSDQDYSPLPLAQLLLEESSNQVSQELQLISNLRGPFQYIVGAYYFQEDAFRRSQFFQSRYDIIARGAGVPSGFEVGGTISSESYAIFTQASYAFTDRLKLTAGVRYTNDRKDGVNSGFQFGPRPYSGPVGAAFDKVTYRVALDYKVTDDILAYASYSTGYKSGGINQVTNPNVANPVFAPETVSAVELGLKTQLLDRRLQLNTALYRNEYQDLQFSIFGLFGPQAFNASGALVQGVEVEFVAVPTPWLQFDGSVTYTDAHFDDQIVEGRQIGGNRVQRTPEFTLNVGATGNWSVGRSAMRLRAEFNRTSSIYYTAFNRNAGFAERDGSDFARGYENANLRLFWFSRGERFSLEGYVTNLFDSVQTGNVFRDINFLDIPNGGGPENVTYRPPRQYGVTAGFRF